MFRGVSVLFVYLSICPCNISAIATHYFQVYALSFGIIRVQKWHCLTVNGICSQWHLGFGNPSKISETTERMIIKIYEVLSSMGRQEIKKWFDTIVLVCKSRVNKVIKCTNSLFSGNASSGHGHFTNICRIINIDVRNWSWKFQIDILRW